MARQSISLTEPNDNWLKQQLSNKEYASKSELINDLIRKQREREEQIFWLRNELTKGEISGISNKSMEQILEEAKKRVR